MAWLSLCFCSDTQEIRNTGHLGGLCKLGHFIKFVADPDPPPPHQKKKRTPLKDLKNGI